MTDQITALHDAGREMTRAFSHVVRPGIEDETARAYLEARGRHSLTIARLDGIEHGQMAGDVLSLLRALDQEAETMTNAYLEVCRAEHRDWTIRFFGAKKRHQEALVASLKGVSNGTTINHLQHKPCFGYDTTRRPQNETRKPADAEVFAT